MMIINKQCIDAYLEMSEIQNQIKSIEDGLERINRKETSIFLAECNFKMEQMVITDFYKKHKILIEKCLIEEAERLKQELNKYIIE